MAHGCRALVVNCIDFRFQTAVRKFLVGRGLEDDYDLAGLAGSGKALSYDDDDERSHLLKQVGISRQKHGISEVYLFQHLDCAAFGGQGAFPSLQQERECMLLVLQNAKVRLEAVFPGLKVIRVLAHITQDRRGRPPDKFAVVFEQLDK